MRLCSVSVARKSAQPLTLTRKDVVFNNAEESLQDGSQLFSTQHPIANTYVVASALTIYP